MFQTIRNHWKEYLIEAWGLGIFMLLVGIYVVAIDSDISPIPKLVPAAIARRAILGTLACFTVIGIVCSRWGKRSGAHINPAFTLALFSIGKMKAIDAVAYVIAQFLGGTVGVVLAAVLLGRSFTEPPINYAVTLPGGLGWFGAFLTEFWMSFVLMGMVLVFMNIKQLESLTPFFLGPLVGLYITFLAPLSGMSINPARTVASALPAGIWTAIWLYLMAPTTGMLLAAWAYCYASKRHPLQLNVKFFPHVTTPCIHCIYTRSSEWRSKN